MAAGRKQLKQQTFWRSHMIKLVGMGAVIAASVMMLGIGPAGGQPAPPSNGAATLAGDWSGVLPGQAPTHVILHVRVAEGGVAATYDNVERDVRGVGLADFRRDGDTVTFALPAARIRYEGQLDAQGRTLTGVLTQGDNLPLQLVLSRTVQ